MTKRITRRKKPRVFIRQLLRIVSLQIRTFRPNVLLRPGRPPYVSKDMSDHVRYVEKRMHCPGVFQSGSNQIDVWQILVYSITMRHWKESNDDRITKTDWSRETLWVDVSEWVDNSSMYIDSVNRPVLRLC